MCKFVVKPILYHCKVEHGPAPRCSAYDDECLDVENPSKCWSGGKNITRNGVLVDAAMADGYCPLMFRGDIGS